MGLLYLLAAVNILLRLPVEENRVTFLCESRDTQKCPLWPERRLINVKVRGI
jgi:hypothetical protein